MRVIGLAVTLAVGLTLMPLAGEAQQAGKVPRVGVLYPGGSGPLSLRMEAFRQGLRDSGYVEGNTVAIESRYADGRGERLVKLAADLVQREVSVIATSGDLATHVVQQATATIPIVAFTDDLVGAGLVASHARLSRVVVLWDPATGTAQLKVIEAAAGSLGVQIRVLEVRSPDALEDAFRLAQKERTQALNVLASPLLAAYSQRIVDLAAKGRLPAIYQWREHVQAGGLMSYGPVLLETWRQTGLLVGRVLKGAKPADLPVEQPTKFELVINLKTAKALGLTVPQSLLLRADHVIQ